MRLAKIATGGEALVWEGTKTARAGRRGFVGPRADRPAENGVTSQWGLSCPVRGVGPVE